MSAEAALQGAVMVALADHAALAVNGVFASMPERFAYPYAVAGEVLAGDWSTKSARGRELRVAAVLHDDGPDRLPELMGHAADAIEGLPRDLGDWRVASVSFVRSRMAKGRADWVGAVEYRVRVMEEL